MSSLSSEEMSAQRSDFGLRLSNSMAQYGPLCVGMILNAHDLIIIITHGLDGHQHGGEFRHGGELRQIRGNSG